MRSNSSRSLREIGFASNCERTRSGPGAFTNNYPGDFCILEAVKGFCHAERSGASKLAPYHTPAKSLTTRLTAVMLSASEASEIPPGQNTAKPPNTPSISPATAGDGGAIIWPKGNSGAVAQLLFLRTRGKPPSDSPAGGGRKLSITHKLGRLPDTSA